MSANEFDGRSMFASAGLEGLRESLRGGEPFAVEGSIERLPDWLQRLAVDGIDGLAARYRGRVLHGRSQQGPRSQLLATADVAALLAAGEALYLPDLADSNPAIGRWLRAFEQVLGIPAGCARATAWVAPAGEGTALHLDAEDVISIQLVGEKVFAVAEPAALPHAAGFQYGPGIPAAADLYPQCASGFPPADAAHFSEVTLRSGSLLVLPRGHWHRTVCGTDSLSVSVVLAPPRVLDHLLETVRLAALQQVPLRRALYGERPYAGADVRAAITALATALPDWLDADPRGDTFQRVPTRTLEGAAIVDTYQGTRTPVALSAAAAQLWAWFDGRPEAVTRAAIVAGVADDPEVALTELVRHGLLYRWPLPRR